MQLSEVQSIARFLNAPVAEVIRHSGAAKDLDGLPTRIVLAATIDGHGVVSRLRESMPLPHGFIERAVAAINGLGNGAIIAAQIRATSGPLAMWDDAIVLFSATDRVETAAIGALAICRQMDGEQVFVKVEKARKTGEASVRSAGDVVREVQLDTAALVIAVLP